MHRAPGVEIAVGLLRGGDAGDDGLELGLQLRIGADAEAEGRAFEDLVDVGVVEGVFGDGLVPGVLFAGGAAFEDVGREIEVG